MPIDLAHDQKTMLPHIEHVYDLGDARNPLQRAHHARLVPHPFEAAAVQPVESRVPAPLLDDDRPLAPRRSPQINTASVGVVNRLLDHEGQLRRIIIVTLVCIF